MAQVFSPRKGFLRIGQLTVGLSLSFVTQVTKSGRFSRFESVVCGGVSEFGDEADFWKNESQKALERARVASVKQN